MPKAEQYNQYISYAVILALLFVFYRMIESYISYLALGIVLAILAYPVHRKINSWLKMDRVSAGITTFLVLLIIVIPTILVLSSLVGEMISFFSHLNLGFFKDVSAFLTNMTGQENYLSDNLKALVTSAGQYLLSSAPNILGSLAEMGIGLLLMFSLTYYVLVEGNSWDERIKLIIPLNQGQKEHLVRVIKKVVHSVLYGEILISIVQGALGGVLFWLLGIPNPVFWGFIMAVLAFLPFVGTALVWGPVVVMRAINGAYLAAIIIVVYGTVLMTGIDYVMRPKIIASASRIHPLSALLGAFGGLHFLGFQGLILGPLVAALIEAIIIFYYEEKKGIGMNGKKPTVRLKARLKPRKSAA